MKLSNSKRIFSGFADKALKKGTISDSEALLALNAKGADIVDLFAEAVRVREVVSGSKIKLCSIINIKSGRCSEDCTFCAQSARYSTDAPVHSLVDHSEMAEMASKMKEWKSRLGIVSSGKGVLKGDSAEFQKILQSIRHLVKKGPVHASLGLLSDETARLLKDAGVEMYHHNIETAPSFFKKICRTHTFADRVHTVKVAKEAGMEVCCGGILGLGETLKQRVEMARAIHNLNVDAIPLNFLNPIPGTPLGNRKPMLPLEALKIVAMFRLVNPKKEVKVCGGRETVLGDLQGMLFFAGASGMMVGGYLTTRGRSVEADHRMVSDCGLTAVK
ncbi:MAG: biotin synthase BioB [Fibrobacteres bacterium]|nr:biotin synthase BioB [Fibrobacterota bacterium]